MKRGLWIAVWLTLVLLLTIPYGRWFNEKVPVDSLPSQPTSNKFLTLCSGLDVTNEAVRLIAVANCLGRVRGFADGHMMTIKMQGNNQLVAPLWCLNESITDKEVFGAVALWTDQNPEQFEKIASSTMAPTASLMVVIAALHQQFPCE